MRAPQSIIDIGHILQLYGQVLRRVFTERWRGDEILRYTVEIGVESLPIILFSTAFAGIVVTQEMAWHMQQALHDVSMMPGFSGQFILRELGIVIPALLIVSKVGAAITAEVGSMTITEQVDALRLLQIDPISYLVCPRWVASLLTSVCSVLIASAVTLLCAIAVAILKFHFDGLEYLNGLRNFLHASDFVITIVKGLVFGSLIPVISCSYGLRCRAGAQGVGEATTQSVVTSTVAIIVLDFGLTYLFTKLTS